MAAYGYVTYPGIGSVINFEFTDISGISPSIGVMDILPQDNIPAANGDINIYYSDDFGGSWRITLQMMHIDSASYVRNSGGKIVQVRFLDERWEWAFGEVSGRYNIKLAKCYDSAFPSAAAVQFVDPKHEKTPQQLVSILIDEMGYDDTDWDFSALPTDARPMTDWDYANPAQELANLADQFGCRIIPIRSKGKWAIVQTGVGGSLPENYPYQDPGDGIDPVEAPQYLKIVTAPILYECRLPLEAVGKDVDQLYRLLPTLSYCPLIPRYSPPLFYTGPTFSSFAYSDEEFSDIDATRFQLPDQTLISPRELAMQTVYKTYKIQGATLSAYYNAPKS